MKLLDVICGFFIVVLAHELPMKLVVDLFRERVRSPLSRLSAEALSRISSFDLDLALLQSLVQVPLVESVVMAAQVQQDILDAVRQSYRLVAYLQSFHALAFLCQRHNLKLVQ